MGIIVEVVLWAMCTSVADFFGVCIFNVSVASQTLLIKAACLIKKLRITIEMEFSIV